MWAAHKYDGGLTTPLPAPRSVKVPSRPELTFRLLQQVFTLSLGLVLLLLTSAGNSSAQVLVTGTVLEQGTAAPVAGANVSEVNGSAVAKTGNHGRFELLVETSPGAVVIEVEGFRQNEQLFSTAVDETVSIGTIFLVPVNQETDIDVLNRTDDSAELQSDAEDFGAAATVSSLLSASRDPFQQAAAFNFSATRFRIRGYDNRYTSVFFNGAPANDPEANRAYFYLWGGLNDVTRNRYNAVGLGFNSFDPQALGGVGDVDVRAGSQRANTRVSVAASNRSWRYRSIISHSTGWNEQGWAFSIAGSAQYAEEGYIPGTYQQGFGYFLGIDKQFGINNRQRLSFNALASPSLRGGASSAVQEIYDITGSNYFNRNWGYQAGQIRNSREYRTHQPLLTLAHEWTPTERTSWETSVLWVTGRNGQTRLERNNAPNPLGTYYQYLPSFSQNEASQAQVREAIIANPDLLQIDWDKLYRINRAQEDIIENADGIMGNSRSGAQARYWVEEQRSDPNRISIASRFRHALTDQISFYGGLIGLYSKVENYKVLDDLLGADFVLNIDPFAERDLASVTAAQFDLDTPNRLIEEGEEFGYNYNSYVARQQLFGQVEYIGRKVDVFAALSANNEDQWRKGNLRNGQFPENSFGESEKENFLTGSTKLGVTYKINGRNYLQANGYYGTKAPDYRDVLVSPRTRNEFVPNLESETITSLEASYQLRAPKLKARITGYATRFTDRMRNIRFFIETADNTTGFGSYILQGVNSDHLGFEAAAEYDITASLELTAALAAGRYQYTSRPTANAYVDNSGVQLVEDEVIYLRNFFVGQTPQQVGSLGLRYEGKQFYTLTLTGSYARYAFADYGPLRRTTDAVRNLEPGSQALLDIVEQEELPQAFTLDLFATKSLKFEDQFIFFTAAVNNLLNNTGIISGAREQLRYDFETQDVNRFPNQYYYAYGTNFFVQVAYQF